MSKYLFVVHSSITLRMARAIIRKYDRPKDACIFLSDRGFQVEEEGIPVLDITSFFIRPIRWRERQDFWSVCRNNRNQLKSLYKLIEEEVAVPFHLYIPHTQPYAYVALIRHPLCRQYAFVEEGMLSYRTYLEDQAEQVSVTKKILLHAVIRYCLGSGFPAFPEWLAHRHPKYGGCYGISKDTFPTLPKENKHVVPVPFERRSEYQVIRQLLVTGPWIEKGFCTVEEYRELKRALFRYWLGKGIQTIHVKFHPRQYHEQLSIPVFREVYQEFKDRIHLIELPQEASVEEIAYSSQADFYLAYSSTTIYASQFGCRVYSYFKTIWNQWPATRDILDNLPPVITQNLIPIDLSLEEGSGKK